MCLRTNHSLIVRAGSNTAFQLLSVLSYGDCTAHSSHQAVRLARSLEGMCEQACKQFHSLAHAHLVCQNAAFDVLLRGWVLLRGHSCEGVCGHMVVQCVWLM